MPDVWMEEEVYDKNKIKNLIKERRRGKVDIQLGKSGLTEGFINEVKRRLKKQGVVKIRILRSYLKSGENDRRSIARKVAELAGARLIEVRGNTFILALKGKSIGKNKNTESILENPIRRGGR